MSIIIIIVIVIIYLHHNHNHLPPFAGLFPALLKTTLYFTLVVLLIPRPVLSDFSVFQPVSAHQFSPYCATYTRRFYHCYFPSTVISTPSHAS